MTKKLTQKDKVLAHLQENKKINPMEALHLYSSFRLGAIIFTLREEGHNIETKMINNGVKKNHFAEYHYKGDGKQMDLEDVIKGGN
jgi:cytidine deaminase